ncbi:MAG: ABC transporter permease [Anaerolineales bacterium]|nr:ABC transporter permease [Anaerolineales bacterium]
MNKATNLPNVIYTPESQIRSPLNLFQKMLHDLLNSKELAWRLFIRDISAQYRQSFLGIFWAFIPPLVTSLVFILLQSHRVINFGETDIPYPVYVLIGTITWQLFTESLNAPLKSTIQAKPILAKINIPYEALIVSAFFNILFSLLLKLIVLAGIFIYFRIELTPALFLLPMAFLLLISLGISIGLLITPFGMLYTDVSSSLPIISQLWFFVTPVIYTPPTSFPLSLITILNPVSPLLIGIRDLMTKGEIAITGTYIMVGFLVPIVLLVAWISFRVSIPIIVERISS